MSSYTIYKKTNGWIDQNVACPPRSLKNYLQEDSNNEYLKGHYPSSKYYVDLSTKTPEEKPQIQPEFDKARIKADGEDIIVITNLPTDDLNGNPIETEVRVSGTEYPINDGNLELSVDAPGEYTINIRATNHKPYRTTIQAYDDED